jgi:hypothetical protein
LSGSVTIDTTTGQVDSASVFLPGAFSAADTVIREAQQGPAYTVSFAGPESQYVFDISAATLVGFQIAPLTWQVYNTDFAGGFVLVGVGRSELGAPVATTPLPAALPMFASALAGAGFFRWMKKRKQKAAQLPA